MAGRQADHQAESHLQLSLPRGVDGQAGEQSVIYTFIAEPGKIYTPPHSFPPARRTRHSWGCTEVIYPFVTYLYPFVRVHKLALGVSRNWTNSIKVKVQIILNIHEFGDEEEENGVLI